MIPAIKGIKVSQQKRAGNSPAFFSTSDPPGKNLSKHSLYDQLL